MKANEFAKYASTLSLNAAALGLLANIRVGTPEHPAASARRVESHVGNSIVRYPSRKMGFVVECESGRVEFVSALELEHDNDVLEFYSQPCAITLRYQSRTNRAQVVAHTPDFVVLRRGSIEFRECKSVDGMTRVAVAQPNRYMRTEAGVWICPPGETAAADFGFSYRVWTPAALSPQFAANLRYLDPHLKRSCDAYVPAEYRPVISYVEQNQGVTVAELGDKSGLEGPALVRWLIAQGHLYCDLHRFLLSESATAVVYTDSQVAKAAVSLVPTIKSLPLQLAGASLPAQRASAISSAYVHFGASAFGCANRRLACLINGASPVPVPARTIRSWKKAYAFAERVYGAGYLGLLPRTAHRGNHKPRLDQSLYDLADAVINEVYLVTAGMRVASAYRHFTERCAQLNLTPPSQVWFWARVRQLTQVDVIAARKGPRAAYPLFGGPNGRIGALDVHGSYPLQVVHIDHTQLDVEIRSAVSPLGLGRPWLTVAFDAATRSVLGFYLSFDGPSVDSLLMVIRDIVLRHELLPFGLTVDNGAEFRSEWFEAFTGLQEIIVWRRPPHHARFGALIENFFGVANAELIHALEGNTQLTKNVRQLTKSIDPAGKAVWTLPALYAVFEAYCFEHFNRRPHPDLGQAPADAFVARVQEHGVPALRRQVYDEAFVLATMVSVEKGTARVQPAKGLKVHNDYYYGPMLANHVGENLPVRFDPMDAGRIFCHVEGHWVSCLSKFATSMAALSVRQAQCWAEEIRRRHGATKNIRGASAARLARFVESLKSQKEGELRLQYERSLANFQVLALNPRLLPSGTPVTPVAPQIRSRSVASTPELAGQLFSIADVETLPTSELPADL